MLQEQILHHYVILVIVELLYIILDVMMTEIQDMFQDLAERYVINGLNYVANKSLIFYN